MKIYVYQNINIIAGNVKDITKEDAEKLEQKLIISKQNKITRSIVRKRAKFPSLDITQSILDEFRQEGDSISSRYHRVKIDFSQKQSRTLLIKEIDRILKN